VKLIIEKRNLIIGGAMIIGGALAAYLEPIGGALVSGMGGIVLQVHLEKPAPDPLAKIRAKAAPAKKP
jgi:hypothetical protein